MPEVKFSTQACDEFTRHPWLGGVIVAMGPTAEVVKHVLDELDEIVAERLTATKRTRFRVERQVEDGPTTEVELGVSVKPDSGEKIRIEPPNAEQKPDGVPGFLVVVSAEFFPRNPRWVVNQIAMAVTFHRVEDWFKVRWLKVESI